MHEVYMDKRDAAALSYLRTCLDGRASRLQRGRFCKGKEVLGTTEDVMDAEASRARLTTGGAGCDGSFKQFTDRMALRQAMTNLTRREKILIFELFWMQKTVRDVCVERGISKNSVLKMKRNALQKMKRILERSD